MSATERQCSVCGVSRPIGAYSKAQKKKGANAKCSLCTGNMSQQQYDAAFPAAAAPIEAEAALQETEKSGVENEGGPAANDNNAAPAKSVADDNEPPVTQSEVSVDPADASPQAGGEAESKEQAPVGDEDTLTCASCSKNLPRSSFSKNQRKKGASARCAECLSGGNNNNDSDSADSAVAESAGSTDDTQPNGGSGNMAEQATSESAVTDETTATPASMSESIVAESALPSAEQPVVGDAANGNAPAIPVNEAASTATGDAIPGATSNDNAPIGGGADESSTTQVAGDADSVAEQPPSEQKQEGQEEHKNEENKKEGQEGEKKAEETQEGGVVAEAAVPSADEPIAGDDAIETPQEAPASDAVGTVATQQSGSGTPGTSGEAESKEQAPVGDEDTLTCASCSKNLPRSSFSKNQRKKGASARCAECLSGGNNNDSDSADSAVAESAGSTDDREQAAGAESNDAQTAPPVNNNESTPMAAAPDALGQTDATTSGSAEASSAAGAEQPAPDNSVQEQAMDQSSAADGTVTPLAGAHEGVVAEPAVPLAEQPIVGDASSIESKGNANVSEATASTPVTEAPASEQQEEQREEGQQPTLQQQQQQQQQQPPPQQQRQEEGNGEQKDEQQLQQPGMVEPQKEHMEQLQHQQQEQSEQQQLQQEEEGEKQKENGEEPQEGGGVVAEAAVPTADEPIAGDEGAPPMEQESEAAGEQVGEEQDAYNSENEEDDVDEGSDDVNEEPEDIALAAGEETADELARSEEEFAALSDKEKAKEIYMVSGKFYLAWCNALVDSLAEYRFGRTRAEVLEVGQMLDERIAALHKANAERRAVLKNVFYTATTVHGWQAGELDPSVEATESMSESVETALQEWKEAYQRQLSEAPDYAEGGAEDEFSGEEASAHEDGQKHSSEGAAVSESGATAIAQESLSQEEEARVEQSLEKKLKEALLLPEEDDDGEYGEEDWDEEEYSSEDAGMQEEADAMVADTPSGETDATAEAFEREAVALEEARRAAVGDASASPAPENQNSNHLDAEDAALAGTAAAGEDGDDSDIAKASSGSSAREEIDAMAVANEGAIEAKLKQLEENRLKAENAGNVEEAAEHRKEIEALKEGGEGLVARMKRLQEERAAEKAAAVKDTEARKEIEELLQQRKGKTKKTGKDVVKKLTAEEKEQLHIQHREEIEQLRAERAGKTRTLGTGLLERLADEEAIDAAKEAELEALRKEREGETAKIQEQMRKEQEALESLMSSLLEKGDDTDWLADDEGGAVNTLLHALEERLAAEEREKQEYEKRMAELEQRRIQRNNKRQNQLLEQQKRMQERRQEELEWEEWQAERQRRAEERKRIREQKARAERGEVPKYRVCLLGPPGSGAKTSLAKRFVENTWSEEAEPGIEETYERTWDLDGETCTVELLDTTGMPEFEEFREDWYASCDGFVIGFDLTRKKFRRPLKPFGATLMKAKGVADLTELPILIIGNKEDLMDKRRIKAGEATRFARNWGAKYMETSTKTGENVGAAIATIVRLMREKKVGGKFPSLPAPDRSAEVADGEEADESNSNADEASGNADNGEGDGKDESSSEDDEPSAGEQKADGDGAESTTAGEAKAESGAEPSANAVADNAPDNIAQSQTTPDEERGKEGGEETSGENGEKNAEGGEASAKAEDEEEKKGNVDSALSSDDLPPNGSEASATQATEATAADMNEAATAGQEEIGDTMPVQGDAVAE